MNPLAKQVFVTVCIKHGLNYFKSFLFDLHNCKLMEEKCFTAKTVSLAVSKTQE